MNPIVFELPMSEAQAERLEMSWADVVMDARGLGLLIGADGTVNGIVRGQVMIHSDAVRVRLEHKPRLMPLGAVNYMLRTLFLR
jgi:hypothetical protein